MQWLHGWPGLHRRRRAYFRPVDPSTIHPAHAPLIDTVVAVRFAHTARPEDRFAGHRLYRILSGQRRVLRPERDFDFLDEGVPER
jgi:hypothetical protein